MTFTIGPKTVIFVTLVAAGLAIFSTENAMVFKVAYALVGVFWGAHTIMSHHREQNRQGLIAQIECFIQLLNELGEGKQFANHLQGVADKVKEGKVTNWIAKNMANDILLLAKGQLSVTDDNGGKKPMMVWLEH